MNKICTDISQSKKLLELGINVNTADMYYFTIIRDYPYSQGKIKTIAKIMDGSFSSNYDTPAWSLSALLGLMPKIYEYENDPEDGGCQPNLCKGWDNNQWHIVYRSSLYITDWYDDPLDAAFEMVCWLKENGKI